MDDWYHSLAAGSSLSPDAACALDERGFIVLPGLVPPGQIVQLTDAYDNAVAAATGNDVKTGSATTRVNDFVNRGPEFDALYVYAPLLQACAHVIGHQFKLSSMHARTLLPHSPSQELHVDVRRDSADWPLVGFILMVDEFRPDNGATRFVHGSHRWQNTPEYVMANRRADHEGQELACGPVGSLVIFNGSVWHGHTANTTAAPRRSIQGAFIPRAGQSGTDFGARMGPETRARLGPLARHILAL